VSLQTSRSQQHILRAEHSTQQYQAADELRFRKRYLLRDEAAKRETQDVHLRETKGLTKHLRSRTVSPAFL
jgi:hypothetical protein